MVSSTTKQTPTSGKTPKASGTSHLDPHRSWSHVSSGTVLSCVNTHTEIGTQNTPAPSQPKKGLATRSSTKDSKYANRNDDLFADVITPYIIGRESNSTLIEITNIQDTNALKAFLCSYNRDDQYPFYGALLKARKYLQRTFIETCWGTKSDVHQRLITSGLEMNKSTTIKAEMKPRKSAKKPAASTPAKSPLPSKPTPATGTSAGTSAAPTPFVFDKSSIPAMQPFRGINRASSQQPSTSSEQRGLDIASPMQETHSGKPNRVRSDSDPTAESSSPEAKRLKPSSMELRESQGYHRPSLIEKGGNTSLSIATLNCRSLAKRHNTSVLPPFLRYLRQTGNDIFVVQETHLASERQQDQINMMFQAKSWIWTPHCGIVSLNPDFVVTSPPILLGPDGRYILTTIKPNSDAASPIAYVLGIYAPAQKAPRGLFFADLAENSQTRAILHQPEVPVFILGDFNYNISSTLPSRYDPWLQLLQGYFIDCFRDNPLPTFLSTRGARQRLDYIYCSDYYHPQVHHTHLESVPYAWTDHSLLSITVRLQSNDRGPGPPTNT
ncbi:Endonuclease/exonuclease/phosphatase [Mucor lusitanicus]